MSRDLRKYQRQTTLRLIIGGLVLLFVVGTGLDLSDLWPGRRAFRAGLPGIGHDPPGRDPGFLPGHRLDRPPFTQ